MSTVGFKLYINWNTTILTFFRITKFMTYFMPHDPELIKLRNIIKRTVEYREKNNVSRKDLLQLLIQLRNTGKISENNDNIWNVESVAGRSKP